MHYAYITTDLFLLQITSSPSVPLPFVYSRLTASPPLPSSSSSSTLPVFVWTGGGGSFCKYGATLCDVCDCVLAKGERMMAADGDLEREAYFLLFISIFFTK